MVRTRHDLDEGSSVNTCVASALLSILLSANLRAQVVAGRVTDEDTGKPLQGVTIRTTAGGEARSGADGAFVIHPPRAGRLVVSFTRIGYQPGRMPVDVAERDTTPLEVVLAPVEQPKAETELDTVSVVGKQDALNPKLQEFE